MNPFTILEIPSDASPEDIKAAYHRLAKRWHPDRFSGEEKVEAETRFRELAEAFSMLKDPVKRLNFQQQAPRPAAAPTEKEPESALERTPEDWAAMARTAFEEGKNDQARALIYYAIRLDEGKAAYHALLASILEKEGSDPRAVVKALEMAVKHAPEDVESQIRLAGHFQNLGMAARAQRHLKIARDLSPNHPKLRAHDKLAAKAQAGAKAQPGTKAQGGPGKKGTPSGPPKGLLDQLKDVWGRLTGKG